MSVAQQANYTQQDYIDRLRLNDRQVLMLQKLIDDALKDADMKAAYFTANKLKNDYITAVKKSVDFKHQPFIQDNNFTQLLNLLYEGWLAKKVEDGDLLNIGIDDTSLMKGTYATKQTIIREQNCIVNAKTENEALFCPAEIVEAELEKLPLISEEQRAAVHHVCYSSQSLSIYEGLAGAGKSFTSIAIKNTFVSRNYSIMGLALSWAAAKVLGVSAGIDDVQAIAKFISSFKKASRTGVQFFPKNTLIIVDEAGLVDTRSMAVILEAQREAKDNWGIDVKVVATGDSLQLLPVGAGAIFNTLIKHVGSSVIETIRRQTQESQRTMVRLSSERRSGESLYIMQRQENIVWADDKEHLESLMVRDYISFRIANPDASALLLAATNAQVHVLNKQVRAIYKSLGMLHGLEIEQRVSDGSSSWNEKFQAGDEIVVRANYRDLVVYELPKDGGEKVDKSEQFRKEYESAMAKALKGSTRFVVDPRFDKENYVEQKIGVFNRFKGKIVHIAPQKNGSYDIHVDMTGEVNGRFVINTYQHRDLENGTLPIHHNYALTIYSSQGQTVEQAFMAFTPKLDFRLFYVGISRHKDDLKLYLDQKEIHQQIDRGVHRINIPYEETTINRYSAMEQLGFVSQIAGKDKQNKTAYDYMEEVRLGTESKVDEAELFKIKPPVASGKINDYDDSFLKVVSADVLTELDRKRWWTDLYISSNSWGATPEKLAQMHDEAEQELPKFMAFKNKALELSGVDKDYVIEPGDRIFTKKRSVRYNVVDVSKLLGQSEELYHTSSLVSQGALRDEREIDGVQGFQDKARDKTHHQAPSAQLGFEEMQHVAYEEQFKGFSVMNLFNEMDKIQQAKQVEKTAGVFDTDLFGLKHETIPVQEEMEVEPVIEEKKIEIPYIPVKEDIIKIDIKGCLQLLGEYEAENQEGFKAWTSRNENKLWEKGKYHEARFLAKDRNGVIREAYDQHGHPQYGTNYPAIFPNVFRDQNTEILFARDTVQWLWTSYVYMTRDAVNEIFDKYDRSVVKLRDYADDNERRILAKTPDVVLWQEKLDYSVLKEFSQNRPMTILVGFDPDEDQVKWAKGLQEELFNKHKLRCNIFPELKGHTPIWDMESRQLNEFNQLLNQRLQSMTQQEDKGRSP